MNKTPADTRLPHEILDEAARWITDGLDDGLTKDAQAARDAWLISDPSHAQAYQEMQKLWAQMDHVSSYSSAPQDQPQKGWSRRWSMAKRRTDVKRRTNWSKSPILGTAIAASLLLMLMPLSGDWMNRLRADHATATGETRLVTLADGSTVQLDTKSAIQVDYTPDQRHIILLQGKALFHVATNPKRPFAVFSNEGIATALGTAFVVAEENGSTLVNVTEHQVRVGYQQGRTDSAILHEGQAIRYDRKNGLGHIRASNTSDATAWTDGALVFNDAPLDDVVQAIGRYHSGTIHAFGKARDIRVSGVFQTKDPVVAIAQLEQSLGVKVRRVTDYFIFITG